MSAGAVDALPLWYQCGYHDVLRCLGICIDGIHISLCMYG